MNPRVRSLKADSNWILLSFILVLCQLTAYPQSEKKSDNTTTLNKVLSFRFYIGMNATKCSLETVEDYEHVVWTDPGHLHDAIFSQSWDYYHHFDHLVHDVKSYQISNIKTFYCPGVSIGLGCEFRISDHFAFQANPTISFNSNKIVYDIVLFDENGNPLINENGEDISRCSIGDRSLKNDGWLDLPLLMKYSLHGFERVYLVGGIVPRLSIKGSRESNTRIFVDPFDLAFEFGLGVKIYKEIGLQLNMYLGMINVLEKKSNFFDLPLQSMKNNQFQILICF